MLFLFLPRLRRKTRPCGSSSPTLNPFASIHVFRTEKRKRSDFRSGQLFLPPTTSFFFPRKKGKATHILFSRKATLEKRFKCHFFCFFKMPTRLWRRHAWSLTKSHSREEERRKNLGIGTLAGGFGFGGGSALTASYQTKKKKECFWRKKLRTPENKNRLGALEEGPAPFHSN